MMIIIFCLFNLRNSFNLCQPIDSGRVIEINAKSIIINHNFTNVLVSINNVSQYSLQDKVILYDIQPIEFSAHSYGFNLTNWAKSRNVCYQTSEQDTFKINGSGFLHWLSNGGFNKSPFFIEQLRIVLFQSNPSEDIDLFISMGIIYLLIIKSIKLCLLKQKNIWIEQLIVSLVFLYLAINLGWPISLIRVWIFYLSAYYVKDRLLRFSLNLIICAYIQPYGLTQLAYILPLSLQFTSIFLHLKSRFIQRSIILILVLISFNHSLSLMNILLFPFLVILYRYLIMSSFLLTFLPFLNPIYTLLIEFTNWLFKWSMSVGVIKGSINIVFIACFILLYHFLIQYRKTNVFFLTLFTLIGIPIFSLPMFYTVTMINIGQGDAFLIQSPFNQSVILIDTGSPYQYRALKTYLDAQAIKRINYLVITHDDSDHNGNVEDLQEEYQIDEIVYKGKDIITEWMYLDHLEFNQITKDDNDSSLVYYTSIFNKDFLFLGDLSVNGEYQLISNYPSLSIDILKIGHHGSNTSTSDVLLKHIKPRIGLISVGKNSYGHPHYEVINRLNDFYITNFDSYHHGDVKFIITPFVTFILNSHNELYIL